MREKQEFTAGSGALCAPNVQERGLAPKEIAEILGVSESWLAKARMRGDGPPYVKVGRSVKYFMSMVSPWLKSRRRLSTSE